MTALQLAVFFQSAFKLSNEQCDELADAINKYFTAKEASIGGDEVLSRVRTGLWQMSLGIHGFEEPTEFSQYVVEKSKELLKLLNSPLTKEGADKIK